LRLARLAVIFLLAALDDELRPLPVNSQQVMACTKHMCGFRGSSMKL